MLGIPVRGGPQAVSPTWPVRYNGAQVPDVYLTEVVPVIDETPDVAVEPVVQPEDPAVESWYQEPIESGNQWLGRQVRVTLSNGNSVEGRLVSVGERELEVARLVGGGEVVYPMLIRAVDTFEVWRRGRAQ